MNIPATHCKYGHPYDESNTYTWRGKRFCRACNLRVVKKRKDTTPPHVDLPDGIEWRPVPGFEERYEVSNLGHIRTIKTGRIRRLAPQASGHFHVDLWRDNVQHTLAVHRLVALAFIGEPEGDKTDVLHGDGNPANNDYRNLRWGTPQENAQDSLRHGTNFNARKTHCPRGHEYDQIRPGRRSCSKCVAERRAQRALVEGEER